jgi:hypothetical protein
MIEEQSVSPAARELLDAARPGLGPDEEAAKRMRAKIAGAVGAGAIGAAAVKTGMLAKLAIVGTVIVAGAGAAYFALRGDRGDEVSAPHVSPSVREPVEMPGSAHHVENEPDQDSIVIDQVNPGRGNLNPGQVNPGLAPKSTTKISTPTGSPKGKPSLAREVELVDRANAALRAKDFRGALAAVHDHAIETGGTGQLAEDALAIEVEATCGLKDPGARARLAAFDAKYPSSAQHSRLEEACK